MAKRTIGKLFCPDRVKLKLISKALKKVSGGMSGRFKSAEPGDRRKLTLKIARVNAVAAQTAKLALDTFRP